MTRDLLDQLAEIDVPPPPLEFDAQLHQRVNRSLLNGQILELFLQGMPWALLQFARAVIATIGFTITGKYQAGKVGKVVRDP